MAFMRTDNTHMDYPRQDGDTPSYLTACIRERIRVPAMQPTTLVQKILRHTGWKQQVLAQRLNVSQATISRWQSGEADPRGSERDRLRALARELELIHNGELDSDFTVPIVGYVGAGGEILFGEGQGSLGEAEMPPNGATKDTVAVVVRGESMAGQLEDGWTVFYDDRQESPTEDMFGKLCVIGLVDGRVLVKKLARGRGQGLYDLYSTNANPLHDQPVAWAARITWIRPS
jgi:DNA-binding transcriptional regulator YiaG